MPQGQQVNFLVVLKLTVFIFAFHLLINYEVAVSKKLWRENISCPNIACRYRCPEIDNQSQDYMIKGNKFFTEKNIHDALSYYDKAAELSPNNVDILENLAECYSKLGYHYGALDEANLILENEPSYCFEGVYYKAKALLGLQRYSEAIWFVIIQMSINKELRKSRNLVNLLTRLIHLEYQQRTGNYDLLKLFKTDWLKEDYADYIGPVEIKDIPGKGRGLIATADIHAGQLLILNKAFAIVYQKDSGDSQWKAYHELVEAVAKKLEVEPEHADWFYKSYAGPEMSYLTNGVGNKSVDYRRIQGICNYTGFTSNTYQSIDFKIVRGGLWIFPSYINHNGFDANTFFEIYGDIMVIRAVKNISNGEEITAAYEVFEDTFENRNHNHKFHGFECSCSLCQADRRDSVEIRENRNRILIQFKNKSVSPTTTETLVDMVEQLDRLRPNNPELNVYIVSPLKRLAGNFFSKGEYDKAAKAMMKVHKIAKNSPMATTAVHCSSAILNCYIAMGNREKILQWIVIVKQDLFIAYGSVEIYKGFEYFAHTITSLKKMDISF